VKFFYIDESGHTGNRLFDPDQPTLFYGVLRSDVNLDVVAEPSVARMRKKLGVARLHAGEFGNAGLASIGGDLLALQKKLRFTFDFYRVKKPDLSIISFYDQVFDAGLNPATGWTHYWTPMRYVMLLKLATLFDEAIAADAWAARIQTKDAKAHPLLKSVCERLIARVGELPDQRSRILIGDALTWAIANPEKLSYNASDAEMVKQVAPNIIGFQFVMNGIARRLRLAESRAARIVVDRQTEFNEAQKVLATGYARATGLRQRMGPGLPEIDMRNMPKIPLTVLPGTQSAGLELVDVHLWCFKRILDRKDVADAGIDLFNAHAGRGRTEQLSLRALEERWEAWFSDLPEMNELNPQQIAFAHQIMTKQEAQRQRRMLGSKVEIVG
jgi:hypothetical protein